MESRRSLADSPPFIRLVQQVNLNSVFLPLVITNSISVLAQADPIFSFYAMVHALAWIKTSNLGQWWLRFSTHSNMCSKHVFWVGIFRLINISSCYTQGNLSSPHCYHWLQCMYLSPCLHPLPHLGTNSSMLNCFRYLT